MRDETDLLFLLVGDGKEKERLQQVAKERALTNVRFEGFISREVYPDLLSACSIGLVCLSPQNKTPVVPGKILGHMAAGLPVAAFLHTASDGHEMIREAGCGVSANSADVDACVAALTGLIRQDDDIKRMGDSGRRYATDPTYTAKITAMAHSPEVEAALLTAYLARAAVTPDPVATASPAVESD